MEPDWRKSSPFVVWPFLLMISSHVDCPTNAMMRFFFFLKDE